MATTTWHLNNIDTEKRDVTEQTAWRHWHEKHERTGTATMTRQPLRRNKRNRFLVLMDVGASVNTASMTTPARRRWLADAGAGVIR
eukprot:CAMPEP_0171614778 /NCGR_PEP_ID=MMETSP0990-20121206/12507_1 /TAXON_ID=483369 /ORGANISM="non described non described, Strain CCMP2098" /LENGTH=85 /DNA_ID=CAMNT_0012178763 /DNA_START=199 /DNA_END=456 /DNA_ORIENTATION=-